MNREEMRDYARAGVADAPPLTNDTKRFIRAALSTMPPADDGRKGRNGPGGIADLIAQMRVPVNHRTADRNGQHPQVNTACREVTP